MEDPGLSEMIYSSGTLQENMVWVTAPPSGELWKVQLVRPEPTSVIRQDLLEKLD